MDKIRLQGVSKRFEDGRWGVRDLDLRVADGEFLVLVGPSGCGKSTTLRLIAGLEPCTGGSVEIDGVRVDRMPPSQRNIAMVFQNYALYPHMTVYRNIGFGLGLRNRGGVVGRLKRLLRRSRFPQTVTWLTRSEIDQRIRQTAQKLGIQDLLNKRPHQLSGGERQRVALGRAIARNPAAFLFDEPLSNLDAKLRNQTRTELKRLHADLNTTMLFVTHDQMEAMTLGDRIAVMRDGRLQQVGTPQQVYNEPENSFVAGFIGNYPMNIWCGAIGERGGQPTFVAKNEGLVATLPEPIGRPLLGHSVRLGVRPEDVLLAPASGDPASNRHGFEFEGRQPGAYRASDKRGSGNQAEVNAGSVTAENDGVVEQIEALGDATVVHIRAINRRQDLGNRVIAKQPGNSVWQLNHKIRFKFREAGVHLFDDTTGKNLRAGKSHSTGDLQA